MDALLVALLLCLWAATPALALLGISRPLTGGNSQQPLLPASPNPASNYSVGFSLASSYGAAPVIIDTPNEEKKTLTWVVYGEKSYQSVMKRLSLESSRHLAYVSRIHFYPEEATKTFSLRPPYGEMDEYFADIPRVMARRLLKKAGLPASHDVGVLAGVIKDLRGKIESQLGIAVTDATLTVPHLEALYQDDVEDICENAGFKYVIPKSMFQPMLWEPSSAYAGYGFGLCEHWRDETACEKEKFPSEQVLAVHYSRAALTSTLATVRSAGW